MNILRGVLLGDGSPPLVPLASLLANHAGWFLTWDSLKRIISAKDPPDLGSIYLLALDPVSSDP